MADDDISIDEFADINSEVKTLSLDDPGLSSQVSKALNDAKAAVAANPNSADAHAQLGQAYFNASDEESALESYNKAISLDKTKPKYYQSKAKVLLFGGSTSEAVETLKAAQAIAPADASVAFDLGKACQADDNVAEALTSFKKAAELDSKHTGAIFEWANYLLNDNDEKSKQTSHEEALKLFQRVISIDAKHVNAHYNAGQILQARGTTEDVKKAAEYFKTATSLDPTDAQFRARLIQCYDFLGMNDDREKARADMHAAYTANKLNPSYTAVGRYCCGQFELKDNFVMAFDHFKLAGADPIKYFFMVYKKGEVHEEKVLYHVSLGCSPARKTATCTYHLDANKGGQQKCYAEWTTEPSYQEVRSLVEKIVSGEAQPK